MTAHPTKLIISAEAGSLFDKVGRVVAEALTRAGGQPVSPANAGDSSGVGGAEAGAMAPADGSTLLICNKGAMTSHPHTAKTYAPNDFVPLCQVAEAPIAVAVGRDSPYRTLAELFAAARDKPGTIRYSTPNAYHTQRLAMSGFEAENGLAFNFLVLPGGNTAAMRHLNDGSVDFAFLAAHNLVGPQKAGELRILAVAHGARLPFLPHVPTFREAGFELVTAIWLGLFAPGAVSAEVRADLIHAAQSASADPETKRAIEALEMVPAFIPQPAFEQKVGADTTFHLGILKGLGAI